MAFYGLQHNVKKGMRADKRWTLYHLCIACLAMLMVYVLSIIYIYIHIKNTLLHHNSITMRGTDLVCLYSCRRVYLYVLMGHVLSV